MEKILSQNPEKLSVTAAARFKAQPSFVTTISSIAGELEDLLGYPHWSSNGQRFTFIEPSDLLLLYVDHAHVQAQALSLDAWNRQIDANAAAFQKIFGAYHLERFESLTCKFDAFLDMHMSQAELAALGFDSVLPNRERMEAILPAANDWYMQLSRTKEPTKEDGPQTPAKQFERVTVEVTPQDQAQSRETFRKTPNLEAFIVDRFDRSAIIQKESSVVGDRLRVVVTVEEKPETLEVKSSFLKALEIAEELTANVYSSIRGLS